MSNIPLQSNPLLQSQKFYYLITGEKGNILEINLPAKNIIDNKIIISKLPNRQQAVQYITTTHGAKTIAWEVTLFKNSKGETCFTWLAAAVKDTGNDKLKLLANLVEQTADVLTAADLDFKPISWNKASEEIYGITAEEVLGKNIKNFLNITYPGTTTEAIRKTLLEEGLWRGEMCFNRYTDGKYVTLLTTFKLLKDEHQNKLGYIISGIDISAIKESELKLKESESRFREVADSAPVSMWMTDADNKLFYVNKPLIQFTGIKNNLDNQYWASLLHPADVEETLEKLRLHIQKRIPIKILCRLKNAAGNYVWIQCTGLPRFLKDGTYIGYIASVIDINETKINEEKFHYQATVLENVMDLVVTTDLDFKIISFNKVAERFYGYTTEEARGKALSQIIDLNYSGTSRNEAISQLQLKGEWSGEMSFTNKDGGKVFLLSTVTYITDTAGKKAGVMAVSRDITERKRIEEKLQQSEAFYRSLIANSLDGMILADAKGTITFVSPPVKNILGYELGEVTGKNTLEFVHPEDRMLAGESFQKEVAESPEIKFIVIRLLKKNGDWLWCMVRGHNQLSNPYINSMIVYFHDDTLRKQATQALKESEQRFKKIVSNLQFGVVMKDTRGKIFMCNKTVLKLLHLDSEKQLMGKTILETIENIITEEGEFIESPELPFNKIIKEKKPIRNAVYGIYHKRFPERKWILVSYDPVTDENGNLLHIICTITDITDRKKLEQQLIREKINHQKLLTQASIEGQEAERREIGKELHDNIGQQLTTIKLFLEIAKSTADDKTVEMLNLAFKGISDVINEVRGISRALVPHTLGDLGLIDSVNDLIETVQRSQRLTIELDYFDFDEDIVPDNQKLMLFRVIQEQLNNIVKHAAASLVTITLKNTDKGIELEVKDDGSGFDLKKIRKGLGLMNIKNRVELFDGNLQVHAAPGSGCTINIQIPLAVHQLI